MTRDEILASQDLATDTFDVPKWGTVTIRELNGIEREELENTIQSFKSGTVKRSARATAAVYSMVNADGAPVFTSADIVALGKKSGSALDVVFDRVLKLNGMSSAEAKVIEKNSETTPAAASGSSLPE